MADNLPYLGGPFFSIYSVQDTDRRRAIKAALRSPVVMHINPLDCIRTERNQDLMKIQAMTELIDRLPPVRLLSWGCVLLIIDGHYRIAAAIVAGVEKILANVSIYPC